MPDDTTGASRFDTTELFQCSCRTRDPPPSPLRRTRLRRFGGAGLPPGVDDHRVPHVARCLHLLQRQRH